jgi:hypothetical protein
MGFIAVLRYAAIPIFCVAYILYQLLVKKKGWRAVKEDVYVSLFIFAVYYVVYFALL